VDVLTRQGTKIAFNPSEYIIKRMKLGHLLKLSEVLILNKEEATLLLKKHKVKEKDILKALYSLGPYVVVVTDRHKKTWAYDGFKKYSILPHKVKVKERTGAGDAFGAGFVSGLIIGKNINDCLKLGLAESESVLRHMGAKNNLLHKNLKKEMKR